MKTTIRTLATLIMLALMCAPSFAQEAPRADSEFYPNLQADADMKTEESGKKPLTPSWGGWITPVFIDEKTGDMELATSVTTLKIWFNLTLWKDANLYLRGKDTFFGVLEGSLPSLNDTDSIPEFNDDKHSNILDVDVAFINTKLLDRSLQIALGRKFYVIGSGLVFNGRGDGLEIDYYSKIVDVKAFALYTGLLAKDNNPYGLSSKDLSDGAERVFAGGTIEKSFLNQTAYLIALGQIDTGNDKDESYQSQYYGAGLKGIIMDGLDYYGEFVYETGKVADSEDISAYGAALGVSYYADLPLHPAVLFQYGYGSGDSNQSLNFRTFGTYVVGFAFRPEAGLSNLHAVKIGAAFAPLSFMEQAWLNRMNIIARYAYYLSDEDTGSGKDIGQGMELSLRWQILYDFSVFLNYGLFVPEYGEDADDNTHFLMGGATLVF